jgi:hypothetical protein
VQQHLLRWRRAAEQQRPKQRLKQRLKRRL